MASLGKIDELTETGSMPKQHTSSKKKKSKDWKLQSFGFLRNEVFSNGRNNKRKTVKQREELWRMFNGALSYSDMQAIFDPLHEGINSDENLPKLAVAYNVIKAPLVNLIGEEFRRKTDVRALALNDDVVNMKDDEFKARLGAYLAELQQKVLQGQPIDESKVKDDLARFDYFLKFDLQSAHEKMANELITVFYNDPTIRLRHVFNSGWVDKIIGAESTYRVGASDKQPRLYNVNSKQFEVLGLTESNLIEDGYAWIEWSYEPLNRVVEELSKYLSTEDIDYLTEKSSNSSYTNLKYSQLGMSKDASIYMGRSEFAPEVVGHTVNGVTPYGKGSPLINIGNAVNEDGDLLMVRGQWISYIKVGIVTFFDENDVEQTRFESEEYKINEDSGETIEWIWVEELWEGIEVGGLVVYVRPAELQLRSKLNPAKVKPYYVGSIMAYGNEQASSLLDSIIPLKQDYDLWANKLRKLWASHVGNVLRLDKSRFDPDMSDEAILTYLKAHNLLFENAFNIADDMTTKAGNMQSYNPVIQMSMANDIQMAMAMLDSIESKIKTHLSLPDSRTGDLKGNEGLGVSQQSALQSSNGTEPLYRLHDDDKVRALTVLLEFTKVLWKDQKLKKQVLLSDMSQFILDFDGEVMNEAELGVVMSNSSDMAQLTNNIMPLAHAYAQNGTIGFSDLIDVMLSNSPSEIKRKMSYAEEKTYKRQNEQQQMMEQEKRKTMEMQQQFLEQQHQWDLEKIRLKATLDAEAKLSMAALNAVNSEMADENGDGVVDDIEMDVALLEAQIQRERMQLEDKWNTEKLRIERIKAQKTNSNK